MLATINKIFDLDLFELNQKKNRALLQTLKTVLLSDASQSVTKNVLLKLFDVIVKKITINEMADKGSPFLWSNINFLIYNHSFDNNDEAHVYLTKALCNFFDSYFDSLPKNFTLEIFSKKNEAVLFPNLGITIDFISNDTSTIKKSDDNSILHSSKGKTENIHINKNLNKIFNLKLLNLASADLKFLFYDIADYINEINIRDDQSGFYNTLCEAIQFIKMNDLCQFNEINNSIRFLVPLNTDHITIHQSFTSDRLLDILFLSQSTNSVILAEALIHEYHHNELNTLMQFVPLLKTDNQLYYSPWRNDARPLIGLYHAIYVYTGVAKFLYKCLCAGNIFNNKREEVYNLLTKRLFQLEIGFFQLSESSLTEDGSLLLKALRSELSNIVDDTNQLNKICFHDELIVHIEQWKKNNIKYSSEIKIPQSWFKSCMHTQVL